ncbi:MAG: YkgJ family cysteine cluster protein [Desulfocapsaceae bacterium]|nr:YkgJ family cysteine cluster protein [Desulfocapsaceae bacterium]
MKTEQTECRQCGTCCNSGGPALHKEDLSLIESGLLPLKRLITIRRGELVQKPDDTTPQAARCELIKIAGTGRDWQCFFYSDTGKGCLIYQDRPLSCRELKCWDTAAVEDLIEKNTLSRFDIVDKDEPIFAYIEEHEAKCPTPDMEALKHAVQAKSKIDLKSLEQLVNEDIRLRSAAVQDLDISLAEELFYFGRPIFQQLQLIGMKVTEAEGRLRLRWPS